MSASRDLSSGLCSTVQSVNVNDKAVLCYAARALLCCALQDFLSRLPLPEMTDPRPNTAPLNLATVLKPRDNPTDLGPKCYMAYGQQEECQMEGGSVTKLHLDMTDAVNILVDVGPGDPVQQQQQRCEDKHVAQPG